MENTILNNFLNTLDSVRKEWAHDHLVGQALDPMNLVNGPQLDIEHDIVEEIVGRGGKFDQAGDVRDIIPFEVVRPDVYMAHYRYRGDEVRPLNPDFHEYFWLTLSIPQYLYGVYLTKLVEENKIDPESLLKPIN